jgi:long-chain fatty acid transport protein
MRRAALLILTAAPLFAGRSAFAAGYYVPDTGTVARSRGGAFVVAANDPTAIVYNPAALSEQRRAQLLVDISVLRLNETFERAGMSGDAESGSTAKGNPPPQFVPALVYTHPFGDRWTGAVGLVAPASPRYKFPKDGPQRFTNSELYLTEATYGFALAVKAHPKVHLGIYGGALLAGVQQDFVLTLNSEAPPSEDPSLDLPAHMSVEDPFTLTAGVGVKAMPAENVEIGFSYRPEANIDAGGTLVTEEPQPAREDVHFKFNLPAIWRGGIRWVQPTWDVEMDVIWEGWGSHDEEILVADDGNFAGTSSVSTPRKFRDAWCVRVGGSVQATSSFQVHAGTYFETGAVPTRTMDAGTYDPAKLGLAAGASMDLSKKLALAVNITHTFMQTMDVEDSQRRQQSPFTEEVVPRDARAVIGNGRYSGSYEMAGISLLARF